ncbi:hypothetical protein [Microbacterium sp. SMR1]|uniref:hypothetical protein n=1 Tax=Microbacterium sp. SMR1 TaxID=1497340 RepID=UPI0011BEFE0D|nr:hypothetical protein [Microbacterium sp. SMR1]
MWVQTTEGLPHEIDDKITNAIGHRADRQDKVWINIETGARVVLAANGGWRTAADSAFHALLVSPSGEVTNVSYGMLGGSVPFDATAEAAATYTKRQEAAVAHITSLLGAEVRRVNYGQVSPVRSL